MNLQKSVNASHPILQKRSILIIDNDLTTIQPVQTLLEHAYFGVKLVATGEEAIDCLNGRKFDLILLEKLLEQEDGVELSKALRCYSSAPILMLSNIHEDIEQIIALENGIDMYLTKPLNPRILLAYVRAMLRMERTVIKQQSARLEEPVSVEEICYHFDHWILNITCHILTTKTGSVVNLTPSEYKLLVVLITHPNRILSRNQLLDLMQSDGESFDRSIDVTMSRLRHKLGKPRWIKTIRANGYLLDIGVRKANNKNKA
ncbi:MAG: response regulator transcription factor [Pseudomonadota bacterium]